MLCSKYRSSYCRLAAAEPAPVPLNFHANAWLDDILETTSYSADWNNQIYNFTYTCLHWRGAPATRVPESAQCQYCRQLQPDSA